MKIAKEHDRDTIQIDARTDFEQISALGRTIWPTFFNLASMTFAWNASLAAGLGFLTYFKYENGTPLSSSSTKEFAQIAAYAICLIGVVYNLGALFAYRLMVTASVNIAKAMSLIDPNKTDFMSAKVLKNLAGGSSKKTLETLTYIFFLVLASAWVVGSANVAMLLGIWAVVPIVAILGCWFFLRR